MPHSPTDEQAQIIADLQAPGPSVMIQAGAGTAKSTTLELAAPGVKAPALALAFNKSIATELARRLPANFTVKTFNGFGHGALMRGLPGVSKWNLETRGKLGKLVSQAAKDAKVSLSGDQWDSIRQLTSRAQQAGIVPRDEGRGLTADSHEAWAALAEELFIPEDEIELSIDLARAVLEANNALTAQGTISFDDQVYASACLWGKFPQFPFMSVDEAQDLNPLNHYMIQQAMRQDGRLAVVGDPRQCHPPGTMIQLSKGRSVTIEDVQIGQEIVSYDTKKTYFSGTNTQGRKILDKTIQHFTGEMIRINTEGPFSHDVTPDHRCLVRWAAKDVYCVYLMRQGNKYRIGTAKSWYNMGKNSGFGPAMRARQEHADALWILTICDSKDSAQVEEKVIWTEFGLPDLVFRFTGGDCTPQDRLDAAWAKIGDNTERAKKCLHHFRRDIRFPVWQMDESNYHGSYKSYITQACNLISGVMEVKVFDGDRRCSTWSRVWVDYYDYSGPVIGLTVEPGEDGKRLYVANGIVTHNSIYGFRGADYMSMTTMRKLKPTWQDRELTMTFRCPKAIVKRQLDHYPRYRAAPANPEGRFMRFEAAGAEQWDGWTWADVQKALSEIPKPRPSLVVMCRNNAPLLSLAFKLIRQGVGVNMLGREIGKGLITLSRKIASEDLTPADITRGLIESWLESEVSLALANGKDDRVAPITDRGECLLAALDNSGVQSAGDLRIVLEKLFSSEGAQVTLSSVHKAKGLEWDCAVHLDPWRIPSKYAVKAARAGDRSQLQQERNLLYVLETRSMHTLINANLEDFQ